ncbi:helix-turn-helix domain-containing protein [Paenibacillus sp. FA6]|uniref:helix-turn-helix domain-containing protein n=1 Tax=Paenibacillus sp. FA6 TaxID=3413029 RepID=UPI003F657E39
MEEARVSFLESLSGFENQMKEQRESRQYASIVEQVRNYIDENYGNADLSLAHLGNVFDTNPKYIGFIFKEQVGVNFVDYLAGVRMEHAQHFLLSTDDSMSKVAARVGYIHAVSFSRVFKKIVGLTPGSYRNRSEQDEEIS